MKGRVAGVLLVSLYAVLWAGGVASYAFLGEPPAHMRWAGPVFMVLAGGLAVWYSTWRYRAALLGAGLAGFAAEVAGVWTGVPFGEYAYTEAFAPLVFRVPLVMICAWTVLAGYLDGLFRRFEWSPVRHALAGAAGLTAIDLVLDPVAAGAMHLWQWEQAGRYYGIPFSNFAGWFGVGIVVFGVLLALGRREPVSRHVPIIGLSLVLFFTVVAWARGLIVPGMLGLALCAAHGLLARGGNRPSDAPCDVCPPGASRSSR